MQNLSVLQKEVIHNKYYDRRPIKNIAVELSLSESHIRSRLNQALHHLRIAGNYKYRQMLERSLHG